jgi:hypothetical protein
MPKQTADQKYTDDQLANMSLGELSKLRGEKNTNQDRVGSFEHRAYMRDDVEANPAKALVYGVVIPVYAALKVLSEVTKDTPLLSTLWKETGLGKSRSRTSLQQMGEGYKGISEGISRRTARGREAARAMFK